MKKIRPAIFAMLRLIMVMSVTALALIHISGG